VHTAVTTELYMSIVSYHTTLPVSTSSTHPPGQLPGGGVGRVGCCGQLGGTTGKGSSGT
jgi:hypothetical protein